MTAFVSDYKPPQSPWASWLRGLCSAFDFFGNYYNYKFSKDPHKADMQAIYLDWVTVGEDMRRAMRIVQKENNISDEQLTFPLNYGAKKKKP